MKKRIALTMVMLMALLTLVGCGNSTCTPADYSAMTVSVLPKAEVTEDELDAQIDSILQSNTYYEQITDRAAQDGDLVEIYYVGSVDGEEFDSGTIGADGDDFQLGSEVMIEGFEEAIMGMSINEQKVAPITFPEDYQAEDLAGQDADFDITLVAIKSIVVPEELTLEMIQAVDPDSSTEEELRAVIRESLEESNATTYEENVRNEIMYYLVDNSEFSEELPEDRIEYFQAELISQQEQFAMMYGYDLETLVSSIYQQTMEEFEADARLQAIENVKYELLMEELVDLEKIEITEEDINLFAEENYEYYGYESAALFIETVGVDTFETVLASEEVFLILEANTTVEALEEEVVTE